MMEASDLVYVEKKQLQFLFGLHFILIVDFSHSNYK